MFEQVNWLAVLVAALSAFFFASWLRPAKGIRTGAKNSAFAQRSAKMWLIDGGYHTLQFTLYGLIIGSMQ